MADKALLIKQQEEAWARGEGSFPDRKQQRHPPFFWREAGPFDWTECPAVEVVVGRLSGVPTLVNSRFSADNLLLHYEQGASVREITADYLLDLETVTAVLQFARERGIPSNGTTEPESIWGELQSNPQAARLRTALLDWNNCSMVELDPQHPPGIPVIVGTRIFADQVVEQFDEGASLETIAGDLKLPPELVRELLVYAGRLTRAVAA